MVPDRLWYRTDCVVIGAVRSHVPARPAARQSFSLLFGPVQGFKMVLCTKS
jgi:hypothetical protein